MHKYIWKPACWVLAHKAKSLLFGKGYDMHELPVVRDFEEGRVTADELDDLSTCDFSATAKDGLSSRARSIASEDTVESGGVTL